MKTIIKSLVLVTLVTFCISSTNKSKTLAIGDSIPGKKIELKNINSKTNYIKDFAKEKGTLVVFSCNTCPFVIGGANFEGWEKEYNDIYKVATANKVGMVLINSNTAKREKGDNIDDMIARAKAKNYMANYVLDKKNKLADAFGAKTTPHVFLFNSDDKLVYEGQINDRHDPRTKKPTEYLRNALKSVGNGQKIEVSKTDAVGCSIKRINK